ncbi:MAG: hypothetical protein ACI9FR_003005 [Cryomorphaceae bacterium]
MTTRPTDLIAIANSELAIKLSKQAKKDADNAEVTGAAEQKSFGEDVWKAVLILNLFRYLLALFLLVVSVIVRMDIGAKLLNKMSHPDLFLVCALALLVSAIVFTYLTNVRQFQLSHILITQFSIDVVLTAFLMHATGSITSGFTMLILILVTTGSVVLHRKQALGFASGAFILMFYEHIFSVLRTGEFVTPRYDLLAGYGVFLITAAWIISYLSLRIQVAEQKSYVPGTETIEEFLVREERNALATALKATDGNKTEAAKLLGMTFRSFRYKLTKYQLD